MVPAPMEASNGGNPKVIVVMPARQAAATLKQTVSEIPLDAVDEIILVDDSSTDETVELARSLPLTVVWHPHQVGYGGNQKTCYMQALNHGADVVVMLHPDGQYEPGLIPNMIAPIIAGEADMVLGSRLAVPGAALAAGMPRWKWLANRFLTTIQNKIMHTNLSEAHTGYRAYSRDLLIGIPFLRNSLDFVFDAEVLYQAKRSDQRNGVEALTSREREVLQLIAEGYTNQGIANELYISVKTVEAHKAHIMAKLHARNRTDLIRYAIRKGIVRLESVEEAQAMLGGDDALAV